MMGWWWCSPLDGDDGPHRPGGAPAVLPGGLLPLSLRHAGGGHPLIGQVVGDLLVSPAVDVQPEDLPHHLRLGGDELKLLVPVDEIAVGGGADPPSVRLPPLDHRLHLLAGVGDGHLVDEKLKLDFQPVVVVGEVDVVPDGDDAHPGVPQILQLHQPPAVAPGEAGEVLDDEDVVPMGHEPLPHGLVALPLLKGVAGAVPVLVEGEGAVGEPLPDEILDDGLLVLDGHIVPVQLLIHGDAAVAGDVKGLDHVPPLSVNNIWSDPIFADNIVSLGVGKRNRK